MASVTVLCLALSLLAPQALGSEVASCRWRTEQGGSNGALECQVDPNQIFETKIEAMATDKAITSVKSLRLHCLSNDSAGLRRRLHNLRDILDSLVTLVENNDAFASQSSKQFWRSLEAIEAVDCPLRPPQRMDLLFITSSLTNSLHTLSIVSSASSLEADVFREGPDLSQVEVSNSQSLRTLPMGLFCPLRSSLRSLNLTGNSLGGIVDTGLTAECPMERLSKIDLSHNDIRTLSRHDLSLPMAMELAELDLSHNGLQLMEDSSLDGLARSLKVLRLTHNSLSSIPVNLFGRGDNQEEGFALRELYLANNTLAGLPTTLMQRLSNLVVLNLSQNAISNTWLDHNLAAFQYLRHLMVLDLSNNQLTFVADSTFQGLAKLQVLTLAHNQLTSLSSSAFASLRQSLHTLVLSNNNIENVPSSLFSSGFAKLSVLGLDHNRIRGLSRDLFNNASSISDLALHHNQLIHIPHPALRPLSHGLKTLDLGDNLISEVHPTALSGFNALYGLRLAGNQLKRLGAKIFEKAENIKMLNLASNQIEHIDQETFKPLKDLKALRLDANKLEELNGLLTTQHRLQWLNVSYNHLQWFDYAFIPKSLQWLNLRGNAIEEMGNYYRQNDFNLVHLDVSHNVLARLDSDGVVHSLKEVLANDNEIAELAANTFNGLSNLTKVNLERNRLSTFSINSIALALEEDPLTRPKARTELSLLGNPLECNCDMEWIQRINQLAEKSPGKFPFVVDWANLTCSLNNRVPNPESVLQPASNTSLASPRLILPLSQVKPTEFICEYEVHCFALCMCCDFFACDCRMKCSDGCQCYHDQTWSENIIQCGKRDHQEVPEFIPMDATAIYLDGNHLQDLSTETFIGRKHLTSLYLNSSHIIVISNKTLNGLSELLILHLDHNEIAELRGGEFVDLVSLKELHLDHNQLSFIHPTTFAPLTSLEVLTLDHNKLITFEVWQLFGNKQLHHVQLASNPWTCDCQFLHKAQSFIQERRGIIRDANELSCIVEASGLSNVIDNASCADVLAVSFRSSTSEAGQSSESSSGTSFLYSIIPIVAIVASAFLIVTSLIILAVAFRKPMSDWISTRYGVTFSPNCNVTPSLGDKGCVGQPVRKQYDAYIHHSVADGIFVQQHLANPLISSGSRLVIHHRDVTTHDPDTIDSVVNASRCVVVVASQEYIRGQDTRSELAVISEKLSKTDETIPVVIISLTSTEPKKGLRSMVGVDKKRCTVIRWNDSNFWHKLRTYLPSPQVLTMQNEQETRLSVQTSAKPSTNDYEDDMWTFVKGVHSNSSNSSNSHNPDSSISTRSTNDNSTTTTTLPAFPRRSNVIVNPLQTQTRLSSRSMTVGGRGQGQGHGHSMRRSSRDPDYMMVNDNVSVFGKHEPIYHTLEPPQSHSTRSRPPRPPRPQGSTVYINSELEVVYPKLRTGHTSQYMDLLTSDNNSEDNLYMEESEAELLVEDTASEGLYDDHRLGGYVPSPAPGGGPVPQKRLLKPMTHQSSLSPNRNPVMKPGQVHGHPKGNNSSYFI